MLFHQSAFSEPPPRIFHGFTVSLFHCFTVALRLA